MKPRLKILDFVTHGGAQYELTKLPHDWVLVNPNGTKPDWNQMCRPINPNIILANHTEARKYEPFDVVIVRGPIPPEKYHPYLKQGSIPIAVVQTTTPFKIMDECKHVVWNSGDAMDKHYKKFPDKKHYYVVHGIDPREFRYLESPVKNSKILTVANVFKKRSNIMGYPLWLSVNRDIKAMDVIGHGNLDMYRHDRQAKNFNDLIQIYNIYDIYFNPTKESAMPRARVEALMCGLPLISTNNYDIGRYMQHKKNAILSNDRNEIVAYMRKMLQSASMRKEFGEAGRDVALEHFHIRNYLSKWADILDEAV